VKTQLIDTEKKRTPYGPLSRKDSIKKRDKKLLSFKGSQAFREEGGPVRKLSYHSSPEGETGKSLLCSDLSDKKKRWPEKREDCEERVDQKGGGTHPPARPGTSREGGRTTLKRKKLNRKRELGYRTELVQPGGENWPEYNDNKGPLGFEENQKKMRRFQEKKG